MQERSNEVANLPDAIKVEDSYNFLCECPALYNRKFNMFSSYFLQNIDEINGTNSWTLIDFMDQQNEYRC